MSNKSSLSGLKWNGISQLVSQTSIIVGSVLLARTLSPDDFGIVAMVTVISSFAALFLDMGFSQALIQKLEVSDNELSSVFWLNLLLGFLLFILINIMAPLIAGFYNNPDLIYLTRYISITFLLSPLPQIPRVLYSREQNFKWLSITTIISIPLSYLFGIIMANYGFSYWSIICQILLSQFLVSLLAWRGIKWRPHFHFSKSDISGILNFSLNTFFNHMLEYWAQNLSGLLIGKKIGPADMGIFNRGRVFILLPVNNISSVISKTYFPRFSSLQNNSPDLKKQFLEVSKFQSMLIIPAMLGLSFVSDEFVHFFLGSQWEDMIPILRIFSILGILSSNYALNDTTVSSQGRADLLLKLGVFEKSFFILSSFVGVQYGLMGVVYANAAASALLFYPKFRLFKSVTQIGFIDHLKNIYLILIRSFLMILLLYIVNEFIHIQNPGFLLLFNSIVGFVIYGILNFIYPETLFLKILQKFNLSKS